MTRYHATVDGNRPFTAEEEAALDVEESTWAAGANDRLAAEARDKRDNLLATTDWTASSDVIMPTAMTTYRQALREVPTQGGFPSEVTWPTKP
tara:strand:- start:350 stop:628 length:279 start_codon:yes stop_codon:yes gene_type:complete